MDGTRAAKRQRREDPTESGVVVDTSSLTMRLPEGYRSPSHRSEHDDEANYSTHDKKSGHDENDGNMLVGADKPKRAGLERLNDLVNVDFVNSIHSLVDTLQEHGQSQYRKLLQTEQSLSAAKRALINTRQELSAEHQARSEAEAENKELSRKVVECEQSAQVTEERPIEERQACEAELKNIINELRQQLDNVQLQCNSKDQDLREAVANQQVAEERAREERQTREVELENMIKELRQQRDNVQLQCNAKDESLREAVANQQKADQTAERMKEEQRASGEEISKLQDDNRELKKKAGEDERALKLLRQTIKARHAAWAYTELKNVELGKEVTEYKQRVTKLQYKICGRDIIVLGHKRKLKERKGEIFNRDRKLASARQKYRRLYREAKEDKDKMRRLGAAIAKLRSGISEHAQKVAEGEEERK
ncbi:hypothetical protein PG988_013432 [Apiospora saccharicola]